MSFEKTEMKKSFDELKLIKVLFRIGQYLGNTPNFQQPKLGYIYTLVIWICYLVLQIVSFCFRYIKVDLRSIQFILDLIDSTREVVLVSVSYLSSIVLLNEWKTFWTILNSFQPYISSRTNKFINIALVLFIVIAVLLTNALELVLWKFTGPEAEYTYSYLIYKYVLLINAHYLLLTIFILRFLKEHFKICNKSLKEVCGSCKGMNLQEINAVLKLKQIKIKLLELYKCKQAFDVLMGWQTFLYLGGCILTILFCINLIIEEKFLVGLEINEFHIAGNVFFSFCIWISAIILLACFEMTRREGYKTHLICYKYQELLSEQVRLRNELILMGILSKSFAPRFSAAGFFELNQTVLLKMLSALTSYLIIIFQLKNDSKK